MTVKKWEQMKLPGDVQAIVRRKARPELQGPLTVEG